MGAVSQDDGRQAALEALREDLRERRFNAALRRAAQLLAKVESSPAEVWALQGKALEGLRRHDEALEAWRAGLDRHPGSARLHLYAGHGCVRAGESSRATQHFHRALAANPALLDAYRGLLNYEAIDPDGREAARILSIALDEGRTAMDRARACYLLGQIHIEAKRDETGFVFYRRANHLVSRGFSARQRQFQLPPITFAITRALLAQDGRRRDSVGETRCPALLIAGLPRSGKSLVESLLAQSHEVLAGGELAFLRQWVSSLDEQRDPRLLAAALRREQGSTLATRYGEFARSQRPDQPTRYVTDTSPANLRRIGHLALRHPEVPVIFCRRDPLDLAVSLYFKHFKTGHAYSYSLSAIGRAIARADGLIDHWLRELPNPMLCVDYESVVSDPAGTLARIDRELGLALGPTGGTPATPGDEAGWRLYPARSIDSQGSISPTLVGFGQRFSRAMRPAMTALEEERRQLSKRG
jgi:tetratricopeptide (TPR) repeat protein